MLCIFSVGHPFQTTTTVAFKSASERVLGSAYSVLDCASEMAISSRQRIVLMVVACIAVVISTTGFVEGTTDASCAAILCPANSVCKNGECKLICASGTANCNGEFTDGCEVNFMDGDVANCGNCGHQCPNPRSYEFVSCVGGKCTYTDKCAAIKCAAYLNADTTCTRGRCRVKCQPGYANCDGVLETNGCEVNLLKDVNNCGKCKRKCRTCRNGVCAY